MDLAFRIAHCSAYVAGNTMGFIAKQSFCIQALEPVRIELEKTISQIAALQFGTFIGSIVGKQLSYITAVPMTVFLGNLIWEFIAETTQAIVSLIEALVNPKKEIIEPHSWLRTAIKVTAIVAGYISNTLFCFHAMPYIKYGTDYMLRIGLPYLLPVYIAPILYPAVPLISTCITPSITLTLGDFVGMGVKRGVLAINYTATTSNIGNVVTTNVLDASSGKITC